MPAARARPLDQPIDGTVWSTTEPDPAVPTDAPTQTQTQPGQATPVSPAAHAGQVAPGAPPVMLGYVRLSQLGMSPAQATAAFSDYARRNGFWLAEVFVEQDSTRPAAFDSLLRAAKQRAAGVIAVPSVDHLAVLGNKPLNHMLERITGAQLHEMDHAPVGRAQPSDGQNKVP